MCWSELSSEHETMEKEALLCGQYTQTAKLNPIQVLHPYLSLVDSLQSVWSIESV